MAMKRSSFDCHSIGQSLKRFKISTSPGELRINRDIELLLAGKQWTSMSMVNHGHCSSDGGGGFANDRRGGRIHAEVYSRNARLVRDPVDPLQLRLTFLIHSRNNSQLLSSSSSSPHTPPNERWTFCIRMPRMYPHEPPAITRVTRDIVPNNENMACLGNVNLGYYHHNNNSASMAILASSPMQHHMEPPVPEQVLIQLLPPTSHHHHHSGARIGNANAHGVTKDWDIDLATCVCNSWTPISTLQDLIDFLMEIPSRRWDWWSKESNQRHHLQQQRYFSS